MGTLGVWISESIAFIFINLVYGIYLWRVDFEKAALETQAKIAHDVKALKKINQIEERESMSRKGSMIKSFISTREQEEILKGLKEDKEKIFDDEKAEFPKIDEENEQKEVCSL